MVPQVPKVHGALWRAQGVSGELVGQMVLSVCSLQPLDPFGSLIAPIDSVSLSLARGHVAVCCMFVFQGQTLLLIFQRGCRVVELVLWSLCRESETENLSLSLGALLVVAKAFN